MSGRRFPLKSWIKLKVARLRVRRQYCESCFGEEPLKYEEFFRWFTAAMDREGDIRCQDGTLVEEG